MLLNTIFTLIWAVAFAAAFPSLSLPKWQSSPRSVEPAKVEPQASQGAPGPVNEQGGFCGWVAVEVPVDEATNKQIDQQANPQANQHTSQQTNQRISQQTNQQISQQGSQQGSHQGSQQNGQQNGQKTGQHTDNQKGDESSARSQTLAPSVHWTWDTSALKNVEPVAPKENSQMYYGISEPAKEGYFAFLTYRFTLPSVNLDHCDHVDVEYTKESKMLLKFKTPESFERATESWDTDKELLLIATANGCTGPSPEDRCYFRATSLTVNKDKQVVVASGAPEHPENVMDSAETEWGFWTPRGTPAGHGNSSATGNSFNYTNNSLEKGPGSTAHDSHGLPVASFGPSFDSRLDDALGYHELPAGSEAFLQRIMTDGEALDIGRNVTKDNCVEPVSRLRRRRTLQARGWWSNLWNGFVDAIKTAYNTVADALSIQGDFNEPVSWDLPGADIPREVSPWSANSIALFKHETISESGEFQEHINIYCVDCGVSGQAVFSGKAKITPLKGIFDGELALRTNMKMVLKVGVDAEIKYSKNIEQDLFTFGLPGLSYGIVTVGPYISVAAKVGLEAAAKGKLLVGGEMGLTQASATLYIFEPSRSTSSGWTPYFKPVMEAEGEIMLAASAALPIKIKVGLKVASFETALGLVEEPAISAVAQVAGSASYNKETGFQGGFKEFNGCAGISTSLNWSNKLSLDILGITSQVLHNTGLQPIAKGCINFKKPAASRPEGAAFYEVSQNKMPAESHRLNTSSPNNSTTSSLVKVTTISSTSSTISLPITLTTKSSVSSPTSSLIKLTTISSASSTTSLPTTLATISSVGSSSISTLNPKVSSKMNSTVSSTVRFTMNSTVSSSMSLTTSAPIRNTASSFISSTVGSPVNSTFSSPVSTTISLSVHSSISSLLTSPTSSPASSPTMSPSSSSSSITPASTETASPKVNTTCTEEEPTPQIFKDGHKFDLAPLLTTTGTSMVASCNDGNLYVAAASNETNNKCSAMWPTSKESVIPFDGSLNVMHYYASAMSAVGVSRLRSSPAYKIPNDAVVTVLVPAPAADGSFFYMAADASNKVFYPIVCEFASKAVPRVFLAKDLSAGIKTLEGGSVADSITGAKVERCFGLSLSPKF
ncbi:hypothetical protein NHJ13051_005770 [Beauveria bassiana]